MQAKQGVLLVRQRLFHAGKQLSVAGALSDDCPARWSSSWGLPRAMYQLMEGFATFAGSRENLSDINDSAGGLGRGNFGGGVPQGAMIREAPPPKKKAKQSEFAKQLDTTRKLSDFYGDAPIRKLHRNKTETILDKKTALLYNLEKRLDGSLVRLGFCSTMPQARQLISHKKICVNKQVVNVASYQVSCGDLISIQEDALPLVRSMIRKSLDRKLVSQFKPTHFEVNYKTLQAVMTSEPQQIRFPCTIDLDLLDKL